MNFEDFVRSMGFELNTLTPEQIRQFEQLYRQCDTRNTQVDNDRFCRALGLGAPTVDEKARSVAATILTDAPTWMYDWHRDGWIQEVLPMSACRMPQQMPLCDSHNAFSVATVLGSCRNLRIDKKDGREELVADLIFAKDTRSQEAFDKVKDGHVTDLSGGYRVYAAHYVEKGETFTFNGRSYEGPVKIATDWAPYEGSLCPVGADEFSKIRAQRSKTQVIISAQGAATSPEQGKNSQEERTMKFETFCRKLGIDAAALTEAQRIALEALFEARCGKLEDNADLPAEIRERAQKLISASDEERSKGAKAESERQNEIRSMCQIQGAESLAEDMIKNNVSVEEARKQVLAHLTKERQAVPVIRMGVTEAEKFCRSAVHGVAMRYGVEVKLPEAGAENFRGRSIVRIAEELLQRNGVNTRNFDSDEIIKRAMSTTDFPVLLGNIANLQLQSAYQYSEETWRDIVEITDASTFHIMTVANFSGVPTFSEILPGGKYKAVSFDEISATNQVKTYGCEMSCTRQMLVNDQLGVFMKQIAQFARGADKLIGDGVWNIITSNPNVQTYGDGTANALFSAKHGNLIANAEALGNVGMTALRLAFRKMKDIKGGAELGLKMERIAVPSELEEEGILLTQNPMMIVDGVGVKNTSAGTALTVEHRLSANSDKNYYGFGGGRIIQVAFLNGNQAPEIVQLNSRNPDMFEVLGRIDVGWAPVEHRYAVKAAV